MITGLKHNLIRSFFLMVMIFLVLSCTQDSIFFDISHEPEPKDPLIPGTPTNMAVVKNQLFVGSRMDNKIFRYTNDGWTTIPSPGALGELATDGVDLYALVFPDGDPLRASSIRRYNLSTESWDISLSFTLYSIQSLYGAGGKIFAGAQLKSDLQQFVIVYLDNAGPSLAIAKYNTSLLTGAVQDSGTIYLATAGNGVFIFSGDSVADFPMPGTAGVVINGITSTGTTILAVSSNGSVYVLYGGVFASFSTGLIFTGALSVWYDRSNNWQPTLLLMGVRGRGSSVVHGYREMVLGGGGNPTTNINTPGDSSPSSVSNRPKYSASIGTQAVQAILQVPDTSRDGPLSYGTFFSDPDWNPPIFAATSRNGLWSYRDGEWNAEY